VARIEAGEREPRPTTDRGPVGHGKDCARDDGDRQDGQDPDTEGQ